MSRWKFWDDEEIGLLQDTMDRPSSEVAMSLGRSPGSVKAMRAKIRNGYIGATERAPWSPEQDAIACDPQLSATEAAAKLGRPVGSINARRSKLGASVGSKYRNDPTCIKDRTLIAKSCAKCGLLLPASYYRRRAGDGRWTSHCRFCTSDHHSHWHANRGKDETDKWDGVYYKAAQRATSAVATRNAEPYTERDEAILSDGALTNLQKALRLGRTYAGIASACRDRGYRSSRWLGEPSLEQWRIDNPNADRIDEITASLKQEFEAAGAPFPTWDWDDEDLKETA